MELLIVGLILYFGGKWLSKKAGPMPHLCQGCGKIYRGDQCTNCCEHGDDRPNCEQCLLEGKRVSVDTIVATGEYQPPESHWANADQEPTDEELFGYA